MTLFVHQRRKVKLKESVAAEMTETAETFGRGMSELFYPYIIDQQYISDYFHYIGGAHLGLQEAQQYS